MKPLRIRPLADDEIDAAARYYRRKRVALAEELYDEVGIALTKLARNPGTGSPRYAHILPGGALRMWILSKFPYVLFYVEHDTHLEVIRFLHSHRDMPAALQDSSGVVK